MAHDDRLATRIRSALHAPRRPGGLASDPDLAAWVAAGVGDAATLPRKDSEDTR
jgi:hypothetical protein